MSHKQNTANAFSVKLQHMKCLRYEMQLFEKMNIGWLDCHHFLVHHDIRLLFQKNIFEAMSLKCQMNYCKHLSLLQNRLHKRSKTALKMYEECDWLWNEPVSIMRISNLFRCMELNIWSNEFENNISAIKHHDMKPIRDILPHMMVPELMMQYCKRLKKQLQTMIKNI